VKTACLLLFLCVTCGAQTKNGTQHKVAKSAAFAASALAAYDSIRSLEDNSDAPDEGFQPRQIEAEKNLAIAEHKVKTDEDKRQFAILKTWMEMIRGCRRWRTPPGTLDVIKVQRNAAFFKASILCSLEADLTFNPSALDDRRRQAAKSPEANCESAANVAYHAAGVQ